MKALTKQVLVVIILLTAFNNSFSQSNYNIHIGPSLPLSDFGLYPINRGGETFISSAAMGVDVGVKYSFQWSEKGFGLFTSFDFFLNDVSNEFKDEAQHLSDNFATTLIKLPVYLNLPLSAGLFSGIT